MKKNKKGFTLVELVIVVAVMAVLIAVAIPTVTSITKTAKEAVANTNAQTIESTLKLKEADMNKTGDVMQELVDQDIFNAIDAAKLGLTEGSFIYNRDTGVVVALIPGTDNEGTEPASADEFLIAFGYADGDATYPLYVLSGEADAEPITAATND